MFSSTHIFLCNIEIRIIINSNLGGGLDLYASIWNKLTKNKSPGQEYCSVRFTALNPFSSTNNYKCYHATGETSNQNYRSINFKHSELRDDHSVFKKVAEKDGILFNHPYFKKMRNSN